jgi:hypothetical protein
LLFSYVRLGASFGVYGFTTFLYCFTWIWHWNSWICWSRGFALSYVSVFPFFCFFLRLQGWMLSLHGPNVVQRALVILQKKMSNCIYSSTIKNSHIPFIVHIGIHVWISNVHFVKTSNQTIHTTYMIIPKLVQKKPSWLHTYNILIVIIAILFPSTTFSFHIGLQILIKFVNMSNLLNLGKIVAFWALHLV